MVEAKKAVSLPENDSDSNAATEGNLKLIVQYWYVCLACDYLNE